SSPTERLPAGHTCPRPWPAHDARWWPSPRGSLRTPARVRAVLRHEEGRCFFQKLPVHSQLRVLSPQPLQLGPLVGIDCAWRVVHPSSFLGHPPTQQGLADPDRSSDLGDRASGVDDQTRGLLPVLRGVTLPLCTHEGHPSLPGRTWRSGCPPNGVNLTPRVWWTV